MSVAGVAGQAPVTGRWRREVLEAGGDQDFLTSTSRAGHRQEAFLSCRWRGPGAQGGPRCHGSPEGLRTRSEGRRP